MLVEIQTKTKAGANDTPLFSVADTKEVTRIKNWLASRFKTKNLTTEVTTITPAQAEYILQHHNSGNRPLNLLKVERFAKAIREGRWLLTSQGLSFSSDEFVNNGQHRLHAIVAAGRPVKMVVAFGEDREAFKVLDNAGVRSGSDVIAIDGKKNARTLAAAARLVLIVEGHISIGQGAENDLLVDTVRGNPDLEGCATLADRIYKYTSAPRAVACFAMFQIRKGTHHLDRLDVFIDRLCDGANLPKSSPVLKLRDGLKDKKFGTTERQSSVRTLAQAAAIVKGWNNYVTGDRDSLNWKRGTPFPTAE